MRGAAIRRIILGYIMAHLTSDMILIRYLIPYSADTRCPSEPTLLLFRNYSLIGHVIIIAPITIELVAVVIRLFRHSRDG
jgi:hypothetical protein